jgi:RNA 2',3'-cyclic 3'-phosphodiesterase
MNRLFIAIPLPQEVRRTLASLARSLPHSQAVAEEQIHLTLRFLGEVDGARQLDIAGCLGDIRLPSFSLCLKGVGIFPPRGMPRVVWAGVTPWEELLTLRATLEKELFAVGIAREKSRFTPHITLARLKNPLHRHLQQFLAGYAFLASEPFVVANFCLYHSRLTERGAKHQQLQTYPLADLPPAEP